MTTFVHACETELLDVTVN